MEKQAQWLIDPDGWYPYCDNCRHEPKNGVMSKYCPECGSLMNVKAEHSSVVLTPDVQERIDDRLATSLIALKALPDSYNKDIIHNNLVKIREIIEANK